VTRVYPLVALGQGMENIVWTGKVGARIWFGDLTNLE
jgi:hypothetical protein